jgi:hypothetical protein
VGIVLALDWSLASAIFEAVEAGARELEALIRKAILALRTAIKVDPAALCAKANARPQPSSR